MSNNRAQYQTFCDQQPDLPIFMQPWYLDVTCGTGAWHVAMVEKSGKWVGAWPYYTKRRWWLTTVTMPVLLRYCGPWVAENHRESSQYLEIVEELSELMPNVARFSQDLPPQAQTLLPLHWHGFKVSQRYTWVLTDIQKQDEVWFGIKSDYRKNKLPKAEKHYTFDTEVTLDTFLAMHAATYKRQGLKLPATDAYIRQLDAALALRNARAIVGARNTETGEIHAACYLIADRHTCYLLMSADVPEYRKTAASVFATWHSIRYANEHWGATTFDFLGSMLKKIASVRKQFGARVQVYQRVERKKWWMIF